MDRPGRAQQRTRFDGPVTLTLLDDTRLDCTAIDLSHGGISLRTAQPVRPATYCALRLMAGAGQPVMAFGHVIYSEPGADGYQTGVQFLQIEGDGAALIASLIAPRGAA